MSGRADGLGALVVVGLVVATVWAARRALVASRLGSRRPIRAGTPDQRAVRWRPPAAVRAWADGRRRQRAAADLPVALEAVARSLRAGSGLHAGLADGALAVRGVLSEELGQVVEACARGQPLADALAGWRETSGVPGVRLAVAALSVAADIGGPQAASVDGVAATLRQRLSAQAEAHALGAQARLSGAVIAAAPLAFALLASAADADNAAFLLTTAPGLAMLVTGVALDVAGAVWMARITRIGGPP